MESSERSPNNKQPKKKKDPEAKRLRVEESAREREKRERRHPSPNKVSPRGKPLGPPIFWYLLASCQEALSVDGAQ